MFKKFCLLAALMAFNASVNYAQDAEKKVDFLEQIYFSGKNKADLYDMVLLTVSHMGGQFDSTKLPSPAFLKQYVFLNRISSQVNAAKDACDVLDLIAVGIRDIDIDEALAQKIKQPSAEATKNATDALAGITKVNNAINTTNSALNTLAWNQYLLSGKAVGFGGLSKLNSASNVVSAGAQIFGAAKGLGLGKGKDKACKDVEAKEIALGEHKFTPAVQPTASDIKEFNSAPPVVTNQASTIVINNISFNQLATLKPSIQNIKGVSAVNDDGFSNNIAALKITHTLSLMDLLANIIKVSAPLKLEVNLVDNKANSGSLTAK